MTRRFARTLKTSLGALLLGIVLTGCPAGIAPTGTFSGNRDASLDVPSDAKESDSPLEGVPTSGDLPSGAGNTFPIDNKIPVSGSGDGAGFNPIVGSEPVIGGGPVSNPVIADAGGITARPDEATIGVRPFVAVSRRCWTGAGLNTPVPEGVTVPARMSKTRTIDLSVLAEYFPIQSNFAQAYPAGTQIRLIWTPGNGNIAQMKHYDTLVLESEPGVRAANIVLNDLPVEEGTLRVYAYEIARRDEEGNLILIRTEDFAENEWVQFPTPFKAVAFLNDPFTHHLFNVDVKPALHIPVLH